MAYTDRAALKIDAEFRGRLDACVLNEAIAKPAGNAFADSILTRPGYGEQAFMPYVMSAPGFDKPQEEITDPEILSAVQANWSRVETGATTP
jgi:hypothetical protein